jgi:hypothetical protein
MMILLKIELMGVKKTGRLLPALHELNISRANSPKHLSIVKPGKSGKIGLRSLGEPIKIRGFP